MMKSRVLLALLPVGFALAFACTQSSKKFGPPPPGTTETTTVSSTSSGPPQIDYCTCLAAIPVNPGDKNSCQTCINTNSNPGEICGNITQKCAQSAGCTIIAKCLHDCNYDPKCIDGCILPFDKDPNYMLFKQFLDCACTKCASNCTLPAPVMCTGMGGGGMGGMGGMGGTGGMGMGGAGGCGGGMDGGC